MQADSSDQFRSLLCIWVFQADLGSSHDSHGTTFKLCFPVSQKCCVDWKRKQMSSSSSARLSLGSTVKKPLIEEAPGLEYPTQLLLLARSHESGVIFESDVFATQWRQLFSK